MKDNEQQSATTADPRGDDRETRERLLREISTLKADLEARRGSNRPVRSSLVGAYQAAISRCYARLDAADEGSGKAQ